MQMAITQNPHVKTPDLLWKEIEKQEREFTDVEQKEPEFDAVGFEALKSRLRSNSKIVVKG